MSVRVVALEGFNSIVSGLFPLLHQELVLVLCFRQIIERQFLTNQRAYF